MTETVEKSRREKLAELMNEVKADELLAIKEMNSFLSGSDAQAFRVKIAGIIEKTMPGSHYDQVFTSMVSCFDNSLLMCQKTLQAEAEQQAAKEKAATRLEAPVAPAEEA